MQRTLLAVLSQAPQTGSDVSLVARSMSVKTCASILFCSIIRIGNPLTMGLGGHPATHPLLTSECHCQGLASLAILGGAG